MSEPFLGQLMLVPYNFSPRGWAFCSGQILPIAQNTALFSLLGTTFGGNGQTTFALPDLRGRTALSSGQGPGLSSYDLGQVGGTESTTLNSSNVPPHIHPLTQIQAASGAKLNNVPNGNILGGANIYTTGAVDSTLGASGNTGPGPSGGPQPFSILQPYLVLNWCIALEGIYPSRN
jgi:microcystin-dependent protein